MIKPTIGRVVYYYTRQNPKPRAAIVTDVVSDEEIFVTVFDWDGRPYQVDLGGGPTSVRLRQPGAHKRDEGQWCEWMPYQVKKSTGSELGEKDAGVQAI